MSWGAERNDELAVSNLSLALNTCFLCIPKMCNVKKTQ